MLQLQIDWTFARTSLELQPPKLTLRKPRPQVFVEQTPAAVTLDIREPKVDVNADAAYAEIGLKGVEQMRNEFAEKAQEVALAGAARRASEGNAFAAIQEGVRIAEITAKSAWPEDTRELNMGLAPVSPVEFAASGGVIVRVSPGGVTYEVPYRPLTSDAIWGAVSVSTEKESIEINAVGDRFSALV